MVTRYERDAIDAFTELLKNSVLDGLGSVEEPTRNAVLDFDVTHTRLYACQPKALWPVDQCLEPTDERHVEPMDAYNVQPR